MPSQLIPSFNAGELSPYLDARSDLEKYVSGCRQLENFIIMPYGGVYRRPGTEYLGAAKYANKRCRLLGFNFSTTTRFILEMGDFYVRFWSNGVQVEDPLSPGDALEVASPYGESELRDVQFIQINDVMYFVHPQHSPYKMVRNADDDWDFSAVSWDWPALLDENTEATTITPSATTGTGITLTASAALFEAGHVGSYWQIGHARGTAFVEKALTATGASSSISVLGAWEFNTYGTWTATVVIERSYDGGTTWEVIRSYKSTADFNAAATGKEEKEALLRINVSSYTSSSGSPRAMITVQESREYGFVKITGVSSGTSATASVVNSLAGTSASKYWSEGAWSTKRGFPRTVALHEGRIFYGGTASRPQSLWGSIVDDFENFRLSASDDAGLFFTLSAQEANPIQWILAQEKLLIGTAGDEWTLGSTESDAAMTPSNVKAARQASFGSKYLRAVIVNDVILFVQRQGRKVRELVYSFEADGWRAPDLTVLSEHITRGEILECAFQQQPDAIYWTITGGGQLVGMTYERDQNVVGWHRHTTEGEFESIATIYGANGADEVWVSVKRIINGQTVRYLERLRTDFRESFDAGEKADWWYLDCAKRRENEEETLGVSGLDHLEGMSVDILADGAVSPSRVVVDGSIDLQEPARKVLVGLPYISQLKPMKFEMQMPDGASRGRMKRVHRIIASLYKSLGGECSTNGTDWDWLYARSMSDEMDASPPVFTGDKEVHVAGSNNRSADIILRQRQPLAMCVLALVAKWDAYGE